MTTQNQTAAPRGAKSRIARALGISPSLVSRLALRGMPLDNEQAAREWRLNNQPEGVGHRADNSGPRKYRQRGKSAPVLPPADDNPAIPAKQPRESSEAYFERVCATERGIYTALMRATKSDPAAVPRLQQWHTSACRARNETESALLDVQQKRGILMNKAEALGVLTETIGAILLQTDSIPNLYNQKFPGLTPDVAEPILQEISNDIRRKTNAWIRQNKLNQKP